MKRLFLMMSVLFMALTAMSQRPLVTLSHDGELSFFSSLSAFEEALDSAKNGDTIYLSEGMFTSKENTITIDKRVSIVGCGYKSHILPNLLVDMSKNREGYMDAPLFDGVRIPILEFKNDSISRNNLKAVEIKKSWIEKISYGGYAGNDVLIDRCIIEEAAMGGAGSSNITLMNSKIMAAPGTGINWVQFINCNIGDCEYCPRIAINSIFNLTGTSVSDVGTLSQSSACLFDGHLYNCLFRSTQSYISSHIISDNCYNLGSNNTATLNTDLECTIDLQEKGYLGNDGTVVGVYGGEFPFSETPSVPTVDSANSSVEYDPATNKLNVTIKVAPN